MAGTANASNGSEDGGGWVVVIWVWRGKCCPWPKRLSVGSIVFFFLPTVVVDDDVVPDGPRAFLTFVPGSFPSVAVAVEDLLAFSLLILGSRFLRGFLVALVLASPLSRFSPPPPSPGPSAYCDGTMGVWRSKAAFGVMALVGEWGDGGDERPGEELSVPGPTNCGRDREPSAAIDMICYAD